MSEARPVMDAPGRACARARAKTLALAATWLLVASCAPPACSDDSERAMRKDVKLVVEDDGPVGGAARERLRRRGVPAIAVVETGLYAANPTQRLRLVRLLGDIGSREAAPILDHLAARDPDPGVREAAEAAKKSLTR